MTSTPQQMLEVNRSVKQMVNEISKLEMVLQSKLSLFDECLCERCTHHHAGSSFAAVPCEAEDADQ